MLRVKVCKTIHEFIHFPPLLPIILICTPPKMQKQVKMSGSK